MNQFNHLEVQYWVSFAQAIGYYAHISYHAGKISIDLNMTQNASLNTIYV